MAQVYTKYDCEQSYDWNYQHAPQVTEGRFATRDSCVGGDSQAAARFLGLPVDCPVGVAAGPLLNGRWLLHYAQLGYDILTYKTVRSRARECYAQPNLQPIQPSTVSAGQVVEASDRMHGSWAISFGMPSQPPEVWTRDLAWTRERLPPHKVLVVSVVATAEPGWSLQEVAADYAQCAKLAVEHGAHAVEVNFSCPNVQSVDGQLYQDVPAAIVVAETVRAAIPSCPLVVKIGLVLSDAQATALFNALSPIVSAISMTNCIACRVRRDGAWLFDGAPRGIGGAAIREASIAQIAKFSKLRSQSSSTLELIGVGGIAEPAHARAYLQAGANSVQVATAAMLDLDLARRIRAELTRAA